MMDDEDLMEVARRRASAKVFSAALDEPEPLASPAVVALKPEAPKSVAQPGKVRGKLQSRQMHVLYFVEWKSNTI